jgi:hypothetical protein
VGKIEKSDLTTESTEKNLSDIKKLCELCGWNVPKKKGMK